MQASILTTEQARANAIDIVEDGRGKQAVHDLVTALRANRRTGSACTKTRAEVSGNNKKIYRQKGTGNARHGDKRAPIFVGGGVVFGPRPRDYTKKVTKSTRRLAFRAALSSRIAEGAVTIVDDFTPATPKTKEMAQLLAGLVGEARSVLLVSGAFAENTLLAARNLPNVLPMTAAELNVEHLVTYQRIVVSSDALPTLAARTTKP
jgi:large subunit ribosomal protein L4